MLQNSGVAITGSGSATPVTSLGNQALSQVVGTSDEWTPHGLGFVTGGWQQDLSPGAIALRVAVRSLWLGLHQLMWI